MTGFNWSLLMLGPTMGGACRLERQRSPPPTAIRQWSSLLEVADNVKESWRNSVPSRCASWAYGSAPAPCAHTLWEAAEDGPSNGSLTLSWETLMELQAPGLATGSICGVFQWVGTHAFLLSLK